MTKQYRPTTTKRSRSTFFIRPPVRLTV